MTVVTKISDKALEPPPTEDSVEPLILSGTSIRRILYILSISWYSFLIAFLIVFPSLAAVVLTVISVILSGIFFYLFVKLVLLSERNDLLIDKYGVRWAYPQNGHFSRQPSVDHPPLNSVVIQPIPTPSKKLVKAPLQNPDVNLSYNFI
ncbi:hypothetical protein WR25_04227 [Diploscapter pachys]|uniref:Uncharacterized protein n=1 Tax=Diploscapter pachys TaxID=2018661 RepID=A0A2A2K1B3_9BILA|nr:hypothetical protein WR25_04227 [Diploscapter pachys]